MNEQKVEISVSVLNAVLQYMGNRPYQEVASFIKAITEEAAPQLQRKTEEVKED
jgi:hypothetical protein